jgi:FdhD protein
LLSRSGVTNMGLDMAKRVGLTLVGRCSGQHFLIYHGAERIVPSAVDVAAVTS